MDTRLFSPANHAGICGSQARVRAAAPGRRAVRAFAALVIAASAVTCARATTTEGGAAADPALAARLDTATEPTRRLHVVFDWNMRDREFRLSGRGVLRLDSATRARVDLFGPRGETLAAAVVEGNRMRVVPANAERLLPPPTLLWSALGVFQPPGDAPLVASSLRDGVAELEYARDATRWRFRFENDTLRRVEWTAAGGRRTVELTGSSGFGLPAAGTFRDLTEFRELTLRATTVEQTTGFDPDVWILPGER